MSTYGKFEYRRIYLFFPSGVENPSICKDSACILNSTVQVLATRCEAVRPHKVDLKTRYLAVAGNFVGLMHLTYSDKGQLNVYKM